MFSVTGLTLAEFIINGYAGHDFYDISRVVGYDLPMMIVPPSGTGNPNWYVGLITRKFIKMITVVLTIEF